MKHFLFILVSLLMSSQVFATSLNDAELKSFVTSTVIELEEIYDLLDGKKFAAAHTKAKAKLDEIKINTGVHPKAKLREKILISGVISTKDHQLSFDQLQNRQKRQITEAILNYRGGLYLDLLNLAKRTQVAYNMALYLTLKDEGPLFNRDVEKITNDIIEAHAVPIEIRDEAHPGLSFIVFDEDVADEDQQYLFNRELVQFLLSIEEASLNESQIERRLYQYKEKFMNAHIRGL